MTAASGPKVTTTEYDLGARRWHATGETLPDSVLDEIRGHDAILLGAIGDPSVPSGVLERGLLLPLRFALDHYVNLRPAQLYPGVASPLASSGWRPDGIDFVVVREGTEGPYAGNGGALRVGTPHEVATEVSVNTALRRRARRARRLRPRRRPARAGSSPWCTRTTCSSTPATCGAAPSRRSAREFPDVEHRLPARRRGHDLPDHRPGPLRRDRHRQPLRRHHHRPRRRHHRRHRPRGQRQHQPRRAPRPSMFEPVHGSAPDIAGQDKADPTAAILSVGAAARPPRPRRRGRRGSSGAVAADLAERGSAPRATHRQSATPSPPRVAGLSPRSRPPATPAPATVCNGRNVQ